jgi:hypothetical protein
MTMATVAHQRPRDYVEAFSRSKVNVSFVEVSATMRSHASTTVRSWPRDLTNSMTQTISTIIKATDTHKCMLEPFSVLSHYRFSEILLPTFLD